MMRTVVLSGVVAVALVVGAAPAAHAVSAVQADKCLDLQDRCLHHEEVVCRVWQSECISHHAQPTRRGSKKHASRRHKV